MAAGVTSEDQIGRAALSQMFWRLPPLIGLGYGVAYMDMINISFAALQMNQALYVRASVDGRGPACSFSATRRARRRTIWC